MAKYIHHRGGYEDSMSTAVEVDSKDVLLNHLNRGVAPGYPMEVSDVEFEHKGIDDRNGWDTYYVTAMAFGERCVIGMIDGIVQ